MAAKKKKTIKARRKKIDWGGIEKEYRIGQLSIKAIARKFRTSDTAIHKKAKKFAWQRDLEGVYQQGVANASIAQDGMESLRRKPLPDRELEVAIQTGVAVVNKHRKYISKLGNLGDNVEGLLVEAFKENDKHFKKTGEYLPTAPKCLLWIKGQHESVTDMINKLTTVRRQTITLDRQAYNLDPKEKKDKGSENQQTEERIQRRMNKLKGC